MDLSKNLFTGLPFEFSIPTECEIIFVADFFYEDLPSGGAELTSEAIIRASPKKLYKLHSSSLTERLLKANKNKLWVFGNNTLVQPDLLDYVREQGFTYSFFEYDYKPCMYRSLKKHELTRNGNSCDCHKTAHGIRNADFAANAKVLFWCSEKQAEQFYKYFPELKGKTTDFIQSSTFFPETVLNLREIRAKKERGEISVIPNRWAVLGSTSWIKGTEDALHFCEQNKMNAVVLQNLPNDKFLEELAKSEGLVFFPRDIDVGSRITTETRLLGGKFIVNQNVLHITESWFQYQTPEKIEEYLLDGPGRFWRVLLEKI